MENLKIFGGILAAILPAFFWLIIFFKKDSAQPEPKKMIFRTFFLGIFSVIPFFGINFALEKSPNLQFFFDYLSQKIVFIEIIIIFLLAFLEEIAKHFAVLRLGSSLKIYFDQIVDGIIYSVSAALGFAFAENFFYFWQAGKFFDFSDTEFWVIFGFRSFGTMLGHVIFSGIFGFFWGHAFLSTAVAKKHNFSVRKFFSKIFQTLKFHIIFRHILISRPSLRGHEKSDLVREALFLATIIHAFFNFFIETEIFGKKLTKLIVPILVFGFVFLGKQFLVPRNVKILKPIKKK